MNTNPIRTGRIIYGWELVTEYAEGQRRYFAQKRHYKLINPKTGKYFRHKSGRLFWAKTQEHAEEIARQNAIEAEHD